MLRKYLSNNDIDDLVINVYLLNTNEEMIANGLDLDRQIFSMCGNSDKKGIMIDEFASQGLSNNCMEVNLLE